MPQWRLACIITPVSGGEILPARDLIHVKKGGRMQYAKYGKDGPDISRLGFGVMRLPRRNKTDYNRVNYTRSVEVMRAAMEAGVDLFDSHHQYHGGNSELAIGKALKGWKGQRIYIQTKTPWYVKKPDRYFARLLEEALDKLGVDCIDYLLHHSMNMEMWKARGKKFIKFTDWAIKRGMIRRRGFSSHDTPENIKVFIDTGEFSAMLVSYNWMNPAVRGVIRHAGRKGMGVTVMNPMMGGMLATSTKQILRLLPGAKSSAEVSLRYVLGTPGVTAALSGMNALKQVKENAAVASRRTPLTARQERALLAKLDSIGKKRKELCTACGYCMPCEHGVDIPANLELLNQARFFGRIQYTRASYAGLKTRAEGDASAAACKRCGACLPKCPNDVPIIKELREAARFF